MRILLVVPLLLAGCADSIVIGHMQTSDEWDQPGAWDAIPEKGTVAGMKVSTIFFSHSNEAGFRADDLAHWGDYLLQYVRWHEHDSDETFRTVQYEPDYVAVWLGIELDSGDARNIFLQTARLALEATEDELQAMADQIVASERVFEAREATEYSDARIASRVYGMYIEGRPRYEGLYEGLGGFAAMQATTHIGASGWLPVPGQVVLERGNWQFHFDTNMKRVDRGTDAAGDLLWIAPTDRVQYMHQDRRNISDAQATAHLEAMLERLGLEPPERTWTWEREELRRHMGD